MPSKLTEEEKDKRRARVKRWREKNRERSNANAQRWRAANRERMREISKKHYAKNPRRHKLVKRLLGLTDEQIADLKLACGNRCQICGVPGVDGDPKGTLNVDHSHETNKVRGMLCFRCNYGLGYFEDDPERLEAAARYLREAKES